MKRILLLGIILLISLTVIAPASADRPGGPGPATITLVGVSAGDTITLAVGESRTFEVQITSPEPFARTQVALDQYYPGRSVFADGIQNAPGGTSATLFITVTGKKSTAALPDGLAPVAVAVAVRYGGGVLQSEYIAFNIRVE